ncbi:acyltransferase [Myceligenerans sp. TRM 65318]|uniref:Acyltransferase n=1 Tax=Myceligenerans pegani TaxID=2776917 RepID=A0ABR9MYD2_9MICO|nr:acyltransferase [Myceligenerans sp. TRM 65318]MBE3018650.1 acyltransferase [Myceligenerans sp. TRM 65318]
MTVVVADHLLAWPRGGFVGVDVFFVISGYLITGLLLREYERTGTVSFTKFYMRRIKRIMPVALLVLLSTVCATFLLVGSERFRSVVGDAITSALFLGNWRFAEAGTDYFQQDLPPSPLQHYWSLAVEEQYYMVWPWLLLGLLLFGVRFLRWRREHARAVAGTAVGLILVGSFAYAMWETTANPTYAYFSTLSRTWELALGAVLAVVSPWVRIASAAARRALAWAGLAGIVAAVFLVAESPGFPAPWALLPTLATAAVIAAGESGPTHNPILTNRMSQYLGEISYSLYLWHWPVVVLLVVVFPGGQGSYYGAALALTVLLSALSYRYVESPARSADWFKWTEGKAPGFVRHASTARRRLLGPAPGWYKSAAVVAAIVLATAATNTVIQRTEPQQFAVKAPVAIGATEADLSDCYGAAALDPRHDCPELNVGDDVVPLPVDAPADTKGAFSCYATKGKPLKDCPMGSTAPDATKVAVVGDSHAALLTPMLKPHLEDLNWHLTPLVGNGCVWREAPDPSSGNCARNMPMIKDRIASGEFDIVIATARRGGDLGALGEYIPLYQEAIAAGSRVVVVADNPDPADEHVECVQAVTFRASEGTCPTPRSVALAEPDLPFEAAKQVDGAIRVDLADFYCTAEECPSVIGNVVVYRDAGGHVTASWGRSLGTYLVEEIRRALRKSA